MTNIISGVIRKTTRLQLMSIARLIVAGVSVAILEELFTYSDIIDLNKEGGVLCHEFPLPISKVTG